MKIELTDEQIERIALSWIEDQQREANGYKGVLDALLRGGHISMVWSWSEAVAHAISVCSNCYAVTHDQVIKSAKYDLKHPQEGTDE